MPRSLSSSSGTTAASSAAGVKDMSVGFWDSFPCWDPFLPKGKLGCCVAGYLFFSWANPTHAQSLL